MNFVANNEEKRTFDPERNFELTTMGGSPDLSNFILKGPDFQLYFSGHPVSVPIEGVDQTLHASVSKTLVWRIVNPPWPIPGRSMDQTRDIVIEALTAFKGVHGYPAGQAVEVEFLPTLD